jgi:hypothetical protein
MQTPGSKPERTEAAAIPELDVAGARLVECGEGLAALQVQISGAHLQQDHLGAIRQDQALVRFEKITEVEFLREIFRRWGRPIAAGRPNLSEVDRLQIGAALEGHPQGSASYFHGLESGAGFNHQGTASLQLDRPKVPAISQQQSPLPAETFQNE